MTTDPQPSPEIPLDSLSLSQLIDFHAARTPDSPYLEDARSERILRYGALRGAVFAWGRMMDHHGLAPHSRVLVDLNDPLAFAVVHLAVIAAGHTSIPVDPDIAWADLVKTADAAGGVSLVISDREIPGAVADTAVLAVDPISGFPKAPVSSTGPGQASRHPRSTAGSALLFTSGSTGKPKGVYLSEEQLLFVARAVARHNVLSPADRGYSPLPLFHVNAQVIGLLSTLSVGATLVIDRRFHRTDFWQLMATRRITWINAVPAILAVLARGASIDAPASLRFIRSASAPLPDAVREAYSDIPLVISWGMTEGASQIAATPLGESMRPGSVGVPVGGQVEARDAAGSVLPVGEVGALWVRGPGVVRSYFEGRAADRFDADGWLATGDLGRLDDDGWIYLVGRSDDVINRGGEKVYPAEVEEVLLGDPRVREAVVVARADLILGQVPVAYIVAVGDPTSPVDSRLVKSLSADLAARCIAELPRFKRPVQIAVVQDVPRAPTGKVLRVRLRELDAVRELIAP